MAWLPPICKLLELVFESFFLPSAFVQGVSFFWDHHLWCYLPAQSLHQQCCQGIYKVFLPFLNCLLSTSLFRPYSRVKSFSCPQSPFLLKCLPVSKSLVSKVQANWKSCTIFNLLILGLVVTFRKPWSRVSIVLLRSRILLSNWPSLTALLYPFERSPLLNLEISILFSCPDSVLCSI